MVLLSQASIDLAFHDTYYCCDKILLYIIGLIYALKN